MTNAQPAAETKQKQNKNKQDNIRTARDINQAGLGTTSRHILLAGKRGNRMLLTHRLIVQTRCQLFVMEKSPYKRWVG
jgi:hypothetical protein